MADWERRKVLKGRFKDYNPQNQLSIEAPEKGFLNRQGESSMKRRTLDVESRSQRVF